MTEIVAIIVGIMFGAVAFGLAAAARAIRMAQDRDRLHHEQRQLEAEAVELLELHEAQRSAELWRWNNPGE